MLWCYNNFAYTSITKRYSRYYVKYVFYVKRYIFSQVAKAQEQCVIFILDRLYILIGKYEMRLND